MVEDERARLAKAKEGQDQWSRETFAQLMVDCYNILGDEGTVKMNWGFYLGRDRQVAVQLHRTDDSITVTTNGLNTLVCVKATEHLLKSRMLQELVKLI